MAKKVDWDEGCVMGYGKVTRFANVESRENLLYAED